MRNSYLVGTNHWDLKGPVRLRRFLDFVRPESIGLEASEELVKNRMFNRQRIKNKIEEMRNFDSTMSKLYAMIGKETPKNNDQMAIDFLNVQGYEIWVPHEYLEQDKTVQIYPIHDEKVLSSVPDRFYMNVLGQEGPYIAEETLEGLSQDILEMDPKTFQEWIDQSYLDFERHSKILYKPENLELAQELDEAMEPRIRNIVSQNRGSRDGIVIVGSNHLFADYGSNLYDRLNDLSPIKIILPQIDDFR